MANADAALRLEHAEVIGAVVLSTVCMVKREAQAEGVKATNSLSLSKALPMASAL